jgi:endo-1,4-beta-xylanase
MKMRSAVASMAVATIAITGCSNDTGRNADATSTTEAARCATADCTLAELAAHAGIRFGVHIEVVDEPSVVLATSEFGQLTNHGIGFGELQPQRGQFDFTAADRAEQIAADVGFPTHGFHWLWDQAELDQTPDWLDAITDADELRAVMSEQLAVIVDRYPSLELINVVNEPFEVTSGEPYDNVFRRVLGPDYLAEVFEIGRQVAPELELVLNENAVEYIPEKADAYLATMRDLTDRGVPVDVAGLQTHMLAGDPNWELFERLMAELDQMGVRIHITEMDAPTSPDDPTRHVIQAARMSRVTRLCLDTPSCDAITVWGVHDGATWLEWFVGPGTEPLLFDTDLNPKSAYDSVASELRTGRPA